MASDKIDKKGAVAKLLEVTQKLAACPVDSQKWDDTFKDVSRAWTALRDTASNSMTAGIGEFFRNVGSGLIEAQKKLDQESETYVRSMLAKSRGDATDSSIPPTASTFRIPRVNAELKCSLETDREQKLNLIFYSDRNDVRELHQQTVQLEIVAVPAPADYINYLQQTPKKRPEAAMSAAAEEEEEEEKEEANGVTLVDAEGALTNVRPTRPRPHIFSFDEAADEREDEGKTEPPSWQEQFATPEARDEAKQIIEALDQKQNGLRRTLIKDLLLPFWNQALIFADGKSSRFIALAVQGKRPELLLWHLAVEPAALQLIYRLPMGARKNLLGLQRLVLALGQAATRKRSPDQPHTASQS